jgi:hypothetical protein
MKSTFGKLTTPALVTSTLLVIAGLECWQFARLRVEAREMGSKASKLRGGITADPHEMARKLEEAIAAERHEAARLSAAEQQILSAEKGLPDIRGHELRSLGYVEGFGLEAAIMIEDLETMHSLMKEKNSAEKFGKINSINMKLAQRMGEMDVIAEMEDKPTEIARFHAATIQKRLGLDSVTTAAVRAQIEKEFNLLAAEKLTRSQCPESDAKAWRKRRGVATNAAAQRVEALLPADKRRPWVVEQSLSLGYAMYSEVKAGSDGQHSLNVGFHLPGLSTVPL